MFSRATIAVTAGADFVVKGTVDFVLLCAKDGGEVVGHKVGGTAGLGRMVGCNFYAKCQTPSAEIEGADSRSDHN